MSLRILHVIGSLAMGGAEQMLAQVLPAIAARGHSVTVLSLRGPYTLSDRLERQGVRVIRADATGRLGTLLTAVRQLRLAVEETGAMVVHAHFVTPITATALLRQRREFAACLTYHNLAYAPGVNKPGIGLEVRKRANRLAARHGMDAHFAVSRAVADHYAHHMGLPELSIVPNPVNFERVDAALAEPEWPHGTGKDAVGILLPGRLVPAKGHALFVEALRSLRGGTTPVQAVFAGYGKQEASLRSQIEEAGLGEDVLFTGEVSHDRMLRLMAGSDVVAVPSLAEGFGMTALEAMAAGRAVVASKVGGLPELVQHDRTGLLHETGSATELASALRRVIVDRTLRHMLGATAREAARAYAVQSVADLQIEHYRAMLDRRDGRG